MDFPKVSIIVIQTREKWIDAAMQSIERQLYPNLEIIQIDNMEKKKTIGECWNIGVEKAEGKYCFFMGDDDMISPDYITTLVAFIETAPVGHSMKGATTYLTAFEDKKTYQIPVKIYPTGMFQRKYLLTHKFDEKLKKRVDTEFYKKYGRDILGLCYWHFGYFYRQHDNMVSGKSVKFVKKKKKEKNKQKLMVEPKVVKGKAK